MGRMLVRGCGYTWLGLHGTNGSPGIPLPRPYIYIYMVGILGAHDFQ
jgi:hypothetical protein